MRFESPLFLWLLVFVPLILVYAIFFRRRDWPTFRYPHAGQLTGALPLSRWKAPWVLGFLRAAAVACLVVALARPQQGLRSEETHTKAADIMICLDASRSMMAIDFKPDNRFQVAKRVVADFIQGREYDRLGLVLFAEHAITQCPLTTDRSALIDIVDEVGIGHIPAEQTAIGVGLATCVNRLKTSQAKSKLIVLVTDGSNNAGAIDPVTAAKTAASFGIRIYSIGAASPGESLIPVDDPVFGRRMVPIKSDLDEDTLLKIAGLTGGKYFRAKNTDGLKTIFKEIDSLEKTDIKVQEYVDYQDLYIGFLIAGLILLCLELLLSKTLLRTLP